MNTITSEVVRLYNQECIKNGIPIYGPQLGHKCTPECLRKDYSHVFKQPVSICTESWIVHLCGPDHCKFGIEHHTEGAVVCSLTGIALHRVFEHHVTQSKTDPNKKNGNHFLNGASLGRKVKQDNVLFSPKNLDKGGRIKCIQACLVQYLTPSKDRVAIHRNGLRRFFNENLKKAKSVYRKTKYPSISQMHLDIHNHRKRLGKLLNPPTPLAPEHLYALALSFNEYFERVSEYGQRVGEELLSTERQLRIFTASMCEFLSSGFSVGDTELIPKNTWFEFYAPAVKSYGDFQGQQCRNMSKFERQFQTICIAPNTSSARYALKYVLPESFQSRWQKKSVLSRLMKDKAHPKTARARIVDTTNTSNVAL